MFEGFQKMFQQSQERQQLAIQNFLINLKNKETAWNNWKRLENVLIAIILICIYFFVSVKFLVILEKNKWSRRRSRFSFNNKKITGKCITKDK